MRAFLAISSAASVAVVLQGCGGSGPTPAPSVHSTTPGADVKTTTPTAAVKTTTPSAPPATTSPAPAPTPATPGDGASLAQWMNELYKGYSPDDDSSSLGVTIQMHTDFAFFCGGGCFMGEADCRVSTAIYNHLVMIKPETNSIAMAAVNGAGSGIFFNQTAIESKLAKCSYQFDGATFNRLNRGCGCGSGGAQNCDDPLCAYFNQDPTDGGNATGTSSHVTRCSCEDPRHYPATKTTEEQCYWKGPSFYMPDGVSEDATRMMLKQRVENSEGPDDRDPSIAKNEYWNEIVVDGVVLQEELGKDAVSIIPAMTYAKTSDAAATASAKEKAVKMAEDMALRYNLATPVPCIAVDTEKDVSTGGPFVFEAEVELIM